METENSIIDYSFVNFIESDSLLTTSQYAKVIFLNIAEKYSTDKDLICEYSLSDGFKINPGDRIILFKLGWQQVSEYILFDWVPISEKKPILEISFHAANLPKNYTEYYQLCYISGANAICGASVPFQFTDSENKKMTFEEIHNVPVHSLRALSTGEFSTISQNEKPECERTVHDGFDNSHSECMIEILRLKNENELLKESLLDTNNSVKRYDNQLNELRVEMKDMKLNLSRTQSDVADLKQRLEMAGDEYKKLYIEKTKTERKFDKLIKKTTSRKNSEITDAIGELEPLPPMPLLSNN